jgi:membrane-associated PAP2 superfamily phosphatase
MRGAHFLSHTLWSMWIAAALAWTVLYALALVERAHAILPAQAPAYLR